MKSLLPIIALLSSFALHAEQVNYSRLDGDYELKFQDIRCPNIISIKTTNDEVELNRFEVTPEGNKSLTTKRFGVGNKNLGDGMRAETTAQESDVEVVVSERVIQKKFLRSEKVVGQTIIQFIQNDDVEQVELIELDHGLRVRECLYKRVTF